MLLPTLACACLVRDLGGHELCPNSETNPREICKRFILTEFRGGGDSEYDPPRECLARCGNLLQLERIQRILQPCFRQIFRKQIGRRAFAIVYTGSSGGRGHFPTAISLPVRLHNAMSDTDL